MISPKENLYWVAIFLNLNFKVFLEDACYVYAEISQDSVYISLSMLPVPSTLNKEKYPLH